MVTILFVLTILLGYHSVFSIKPNVNPQCLGIKACLQHSTLSTSANELYWYDPIVKSCVMLERDCSLPNSNMTFSSINKCQRICAVKIPSSLPSPKDCDQSSGDCDKDLPPSSSTSSTSSYSSGRKVSLVISMIFGVSVMVLVVVFAGTVYFIKIQKNKDSHKKRKLENMLNTLSDPNGSSSDESFGDAEEDNLFDRLERSQYFQY